MFRSGWYMRARQSCHVRSSALTALLLLLALLPLACGTGTPLNRDGDVVILTDDNFDGAVSNGVWMVDVFATWCVHCQQLEPMWKSFAAEMRSNGVNVAKVDGPRNRVLLRRLGVKGYPSIFLLRDGRTWEYEGARSIAEMRAFALKGYRSAEALPFYQAPNSLLGRVLGWLHGLPSVARRVYEYLSEEKGLPDSVLVAALLLVPLLLGGVAICLLDAFYTHRARAAFDSEHLLQQQEQLLQQQQQRAHQD